MKLIYIEWEDAVSQSGWHSKKDMEEWVSDDNICVKEVGWLYKETKKYIVLVGRLSPYKDHNKTDMDYGLLQKIPKTWIRKRKNLTMYI